MKRILWLVFTAIYLFTSSALVHASTMWLFHISHISHHTISHCHSNTTSTSQKKSTQNMNCCELFASNHYSQINSNFKDHITYFHTANIQNKPDHIYAIPHTIFKHWVAFSPWGQTSLGKYNKFSDLSTGIIVNLS